MIYRQLYTLLFCLALPFILLRLLYRSIKAPAYRHRWIERFGFVTPVANDRKTLWVHAVSVGETLAALPLIRRLLQDYPDHVLILTTTTPTGSERVQALFTHELASGRLQHSYAPYDLPWMLDRFLDRCHPSMVVIMETELWPNLVHGCALRVIPVIVANARLSEKSARGYGRLAALTRSMLGEITAIASQNRTDGERFIALGLAADKLSVTGSIKFDLELGDDIRAMAAQQRANWNCSDRRSVWLAASTHPGEDEIIVDAFLELRKSFPSLLLVLVPRHPERFNRVYELCRSKQLTLARRSENINAPIEENVTVLLGDTMGELLWMYGACDIAFVGGSLVPVGGHNLIEPAAWAKPIVTGHHLHNFSEISALLSAQQALYVCQSPAELQAIMSSLLADPETGRRAGMNAQKVADENRGALARLLAVIAPYA